MDKSKTGGPAFPVSVPVDFQFVNEGMSYRDFVAVNIAPYFLKMMSGLAMDGKMAIEDIAPSASAASYEFADVMVAARGEAPR